MFNSYQQRYSFFFDQDLLELTINLFMSCYLGSISTCYVDNTLMSLDGHLDTTRSTPLHYVAKTSTSRGGYLHHMIDTLVLCYQNIDTILSQIKL